MTLPLTEKIWLFRSAPGEVPEEQIKKTAQDLGIPEIIVRIMAFRGVSDNDILNEFLTPALAQLPQPHLMKGMEKAVEILLDALRSPKPITVFGDFDADGVTATSLLTLFFNKIGAAPIQYYIPDRLSEGYGLNSEALKKIHESNMLQWGNAGVLLTADCGISDVDIVDEAKCLGFTVIITDHHKPPASLPMADTILNPLQPGCLFPCKDLAGVGVAFYLIMGLRSELMKNGYWPENKMPNLKSYMDLVAIGTVADQVPVTGCNRIIVRAGLEILNMAGRIGLRQLLDWNKFNGRSVSAEDIAFRLAPRINAAGRIGSAITAVNLMTTNSQKEAKQFAKELEEANNIRKNIEANIFSDAVQMVSKETLESAKSLVLYKNDWHQGVLGIVASRLCEQYHRPVILLTDCGPNVLNDPVKLVKGSGRSIEGVDIHEAVTSCQDMLHRYGGHSGAVGLTLPLVNIESFRYQFDEFVKDHGSKQTSTPRLLIDLQITPSELFDQEFLAAYNALSPFGNGNPEPVFCLRSQKLSNLRQVGSNHLRFSLMADNGMMNGIGFGFGGLIELLHNNLFDLAFSLRLNSYLGQEKWEIHLVDLQPSAP